MCAYIPQVPKYSEPSMQTNLNISFQNKEADF